VTFLAVFGPYILPVLQNRNLWAAISLIAILLFTSGHMFNHIRKVPYVAGDGRGGVSYFAGGFSNQYGLETQIVAAMCKLPCECSPTHANIKCHRWTSCICYHIFGYQGTKNFGPQGTASHCSHLEWCHLPYVQLST